MRTNIDIDDRLMRKAMKSCGAKTKKAAVETALKLLADTHAQAAFRKFRGKVQWEGNLEQSRMSRVSD